MAEVTAALRWGSEAWRRCANLVVALVCGVTVPLSPLVAEYVVTHDIMQSSWSAVGVTYVAGVGLVSNNQNIRFLGLFLAAVLAFLYGVDMEDAYAHMHLHAAGAPHPHAVTAVKWMILAASMEYGLERAGRHLFGGKPFWEA